MYGCTTWTLTPGVKGRWKQHKDAEQICGSSTPQNSSCTATYFPSHKPCKESKQEMQSISGRSKDELISDVLLRTPTHGHTSVDQTAKIYIYYLRENTGCCLEDLLRVMTN